MKSMVKLSLHTTPNTSGAEITLNSINTIERKVERKSEY